MKVSIIVPNYNGEDYLLKCIKTLYYQTLNLIFEIIVVDNDSKDDSLKTIGRYKDVKLIKLKKNQGFSKAVNEGIKVAKGEYVVLLNNDTEVDESWLLELVNCIEKDNKIFSCGSKMVRYNERDKIDDAGDEYNILGWANKKGDGVSIEKYTSDGFVFSCCAGAAIYRKSIFYEIGYFDENFFAYMEDVDIGYRAKINGYKNVYCSKAIVYHIGSATTGSKYNSFKVKFAARNNIYMIYKNMPIVQFIVNLPFIALGFLTKGIFFSIRGFGKEYFKGIIEGFKGLKNIKKTKFRLKNLKNYFVIEFEMIINTFKYVFEKIFV